MHTPFIAGFSEELVKLSYGGCIPMGMDGDPCWSDRFKGTPLHEQALQLEEQQAEADLQMEQRRATEREARMGEQKSYEIEDQQRGQFRIARKELELQLLRVQRSAVGGQREGGWQDLDFAAQPPAAPQAAGGGTPPPPATTGPGQ